MKLLFVTHNVPRFPGDAAGSFVLRLAVALQQAGALVHVIAPGAPGLPVDDVQSGVRIHRVRYASDERMTLAYTGTMAEAVRQSWSARLALFGLFRHLRREIRQELRDAAKSGQPYDAVHAHWWFPSGLIVLLAGLRRSLMPPLVVTMHGSDVRLAQSVRASHHVMRAVLRRASAVTAVSEWLAARARAMVGNLTVHVAPMPIDADLFTFAPPGVQPSGVLFVGRLNTQKGLGDLLEAMARMRDRAATLDVIGDGAEDTALRRQAERLGIIDRVRWHGALPQRDVVPFYQAAQVVAIPSVEEGLGLVAVEAQLCGTPVVAYDSGGLPDVVKPDAGGTLVPAGNIAELADALDRVLARDANSARVARDAASAARNAMLETFSPASAATHYLELYESVRSTSIRIPIVA